MTPQSNETSLFAASTILFNDNWESEVSSRLQLCILVKKKKSHEGQGIVSNQVFIIIREQCARVVHQQWADSAHLIYTALSFYKCRIDLRAIPINHRSAGKRQRPGWNELSFGPARKITGVQTDVERQRKRIDRKIVRWTARERGQCGWGPTAMRALLGSGGSDNARLTTAFWEHRSLSLLTFVSFTLSGALTSPHLPSLCLSVRLADYVYAASQMRQRSPGHYSVTSSRPLLWEQLSKPT